MTQLRHVAGEASLSRSSLSPVALSLSPASAHSDLAFNSLAKAAMAVFRHCAGVLARIALASLPASSCPRCRRCAGVVADLTFKGPVGTALAFASVALAFCPHCTGVSPASCYCCPRRRCAGVVTLGAWASSPSSRAPHGGVRPSTVIAVRGIIAISGVVYARPPFSVA
jgi:hypothetical protein